MDHFCVGQRQFYQADIIEVFRHFVGDAANVRRKLSDGLDLLAAEAFKIDITKRPKLRRIKMGVKYLPQRL